MLEFENERYIGIIPSGGGGSAVIVHGTNFTGSNITKDDKVWINSYHYTSGTESSALAVTYGYQAHYMPDGLHYYSGSNGKYYEVGNNTSLGTLTYYSGSLTYGNCYRMPDGVVYSKNSNGIQRVDSGIGWSKAGCVPIWNTSEYIIDKTNSAILHIDPSDGSVIKTLTLTNCSFSGASSYRYIYISEGIIVGYCQTPSSVFAKFTLDEENSTFTITNLSGSWSNFMSAYMIGVTSDSKYLIIEGNGLYDISDLNNPQNVYSSGIFPTDIPTNNAYQTYNPQNDIYTSTGTDGRGLATVSQGLSKTIHYDKTTQTFIEIAMDYETLIGSDNSYFLGVCGTANSLTKFIYQLNSANSTKIKYLQDIEGVNLVKYSSSTITQDSQTGIADENILVGATGNVKVGAVIILPSA